MTTFLDCHCNSTLTPQIFNLELRSTDGMCDFPRRLLREIELIALAVVSLYEISPSDGVVVSLSLFMRCTFPPILLLWLRRESVPRIILIQVLECVNGYTSQ